jgi:lipid-binding SYLF domain-containing protein
MSLLCRSSVRHSMCFLIALLFAVGPISHASDADDKPDQRLRNAHAGFHEVMEQPDKGIPLALFDKAKCIVIIPGVKKGAFIVGAKYGRGYVSCRRGEQRKFGPPASIRIEGGSYGLQIGGSSTDVFMLIMNETGMNRLLADKFTIGAEAAAAAGPVGRNASGDTDVLLHAEILTWSRSRGVFGGLSLEGSTLRPDNSENHNLYGRDITNTEILQGNIPVPRAGRELIGTLNRYSGATAREDVAAALRNSGTATLNEVHFESGKAEITSYSEDALTKVAQALKDNPTWKIRVEGFTDSVGDKEFNLRLSNERAEAVMHWLVDHGIDQGRLSAKGYGEARPVASNSTEKGRLKNRRVVLVRE